MHEGAYRCCRVGVEVRKRQNGTVSCSAELIKGIRAVMFNGVGIDGRGRYGLYMKNLEVNTGRLKDSTTSIALASPHVSRAYDRYSACAANLTLRQGTGMQLLARLSLRPEPHSTCRTVGGSVRLADRSRVRMQLQRSRIPAIGYDSKEMHSLDVL
jgi:hypothetical protein